MNSDKPKKERKRPGMFDIVKYSCLISLAANVLYAIVETVCVKLKGWMPFQRELMGGECIEYVGMYWRITHLVPLTSMDDPSPGGRDIQSFSFLKLLLCIALLAFVIWIILCLVNRYLKPVFVLIGGIAAIAFTIAGVKKGKELWENTPVELTNITIITSDIHPGVYNGMFYPHSATRFVPPGEDGRYGHSERDGMPIRDLIQPAEITGDTLRALIKAAKEIKEDSNLDYNGEFQYRVIVVYKTKGGYGRVRFDGYDSFPEKWPEFIRLVNETCGIDYLRENPEPTVLTADWFAETYGIDQSTLPEGADVYEYLVKTKITKRSCCCLNGSGELFPFNPGESFENYLEGFK